MSELQPLQDLEAWHERRDPWDYESNPDDKRRLDVLLSEIPERSYRRVLDIGCGQGFVTVHLPGAQVLGVDVSSNAIEWAQRQKTHRVRFAQASIFNLAQQHPGPFDLVIITGVLYPQYIGNALSNIYLQVDQVLAPDGILICVHIRDWYRARFPYLLVARHDYPYREFTHRLEVYAK